MAHKPGQQRFHKLRHRRGPAGSGPRTGPRRRPTKTAHPAFKNRPKSRPEKTTRKPANKPGPRPEDQFEEEPEAERDTDLIAGDWTETGEGDEGLDEGLMDEAGVSVDDVSDVMDADAAEKEPETNDAVLDATWGSGQAPAEEEGPQGRIPMVAIVGRPNVGKSSLFNRIARSRIAIEDPLPGTTRDRVSTLVRFHAAGIERVIELFDTAGIGVVDEARVEEHVHEQIQFGIAGADVVVFLTDAKSGPLALDRVAAEMLRRTGKPVVLVANKADADTQDELAGAFYELGLGEPLPVSAKQARNIGALMKAVAEKLPPRARAEKLERPELMLAIVGRRNAGKSSVVNTLAADNRVIVSEMEGTTRDSVDVRFEYNGKRFVAIDTAGVRRKSSLANSVEFYSQSRSFRAIRRAHVVVLLVDAREPVSKIERDLVEACLHEHKPVIIGVNKWDLTGGKITTDKFEKYFRRRLGKISYAPIVFMSAKTALNVFAMVDLAMELHAQAGTRVGTGELNRVINAAYEKHHPQPRKSKLGRLFYATQFQTYPPTIILFVNDPTLFPDNWRLYLQKQLQEHTPFAEVPINLILRARERVVLDKDKL
ncbi:MAG: ribosome biogenesis GTPase Der [Planctomycetes bacterium]|nr:ribosome biogenesis GTPase Der [Planctomycetota bacterium]